MSQAIYITLDAEVTTENPRVGGSIPPLGTSFSAEN
jgi:hypothetical protein